MNETFYELKNLFVFPIAFIGIWVLGNLLKKLLWRKLEFIFKHTHWEWDGELLKALERPCRYLVLFGSLSLSLQWAPVEFSGYWLTPILLKAAIVTVFGWLGDRTTIVLLFKTHLLRGLSSSLKSLLINIVRIGIYSVVALIILDSLGVSITPFLASLGVGSLAVALALQDTLGNLFSGFYLVLDRPIRIEDMIRLEDGTEGRVKNIGWRSTKIELGSGNTVILPNSKLSSSRITNYELPTPEVTFNVTFDVAVTNDLQKVEELVAKVAKQSQNSLPVAVHDFEPVVQFQRFSDLGLNLSVVLKSNRFSDQGLLRHEFLKRLVQSFKSEGIDLTAWSRPVGERGSPYLNK